MDSSPECVFSVKPWRLVFQSEKYQPPPSVWVPGRAPAGAEQAECLERRVCDYEPGSAELITCADFYIMSQNSILREFVCL